jgi:REP element-mobilizing transposase RayT
MRAALMAPDFRLARVFNRTRAGHRFYLAAWVFLPDHWHCIVAPQYPQTISQVIKSVKNDRGEKGMNGPRG